MKATLQRKIIIGRRYNREKKKQGGRADRDFSGGKNYRPKTDEKLAKENKVSSKNTNNNVLTLSDDELY